MESLSRCLVFCILFSLILAASSLVPALGMRLSDLAQLKLDMVGADVVFLQECLSELGYLVGTADGIFGPSTQRAVIELQQITGLNPDGIVGKETWQKLQELLEAAQGVHVVQPGETLWGIARELNVTVSELAAVNGIANPDRLMVGEELVVPMGRSGSLSTRVPAVRLMHWDEVNRLFPKSATATVLDLQSGLRFQVKRLFGTYHADVEPLTAADTRTMKKAIGGKWSWARRPIVVEYSGFRIAASMNGVPHGRSSISDNEFTGHFCLHFLGSRLHSRGRTDKEHQTAVMQAARYNQDAERLMPSR
ncbi:MAG: LysM peptidoglycan-binding domain-containing protein [Firmicutes bacterium]|nr:LysM peptidoglycan-binding domain-containing protein [Bacillota bacterium]